MMRTTTISSAAQNEARLSEFAREVLSGLDSEQKSIPCRFLYDAKGSEIFEAITYLDEYYPTRTEISLLKAHSDEIASFAGEQAQLVEFGSGSSRKTRYLIEALVNIQSYIPIDISLSALAEAKKDLSNRFPDLNVTPVHADFTNRFELPATPEGSRRLGFFPGSTLGNFKRDGAREFLQTALEILGPESGLVIGIDTPKDTSVLIPAYDDAKGVSADFNLNLLTRVNRELQGNFDLSKFQHLATYQEETASVELFLQSLEDQQVSVMGEEFQFRKDEKIHTESSHKYTINSFNQLAEESGWRSLKHWTDSENLFSIHYLLPQ